MKPKWNNTPLCRHEPENPCILLEIHYRKNLAKLKGAAVRITGNKPEEKKYDERKKHRQKQKKKESSPARNWTCTPTSPSAESEASYHGTMRQIHSSILKINSLKYFSLPFTLLEPFGVVIIMNSKVHLTKNSLNEYFKTILHYFCIYSFSGFITAGQWTHWSSSLLLLLKFRSWFFACSLNFIGLLRVVITPSVTSELTGR